MMRCAFAVVGNRYSQPKADILQSVQSRCHFPTTGKHPGLPAAYASCWQDLDLRGYDPEAHRLPAGMRQG